MSKVLFWLLSAMVFLFGRLFVSDIYSEGTVIGGLIYGLAVGGFVSPFIYGEDIQLPTYGHMLVKGENDALRIGAFIIAICACLAAILAP